MNLGWGIQKQNEACAKHHVRIKRNRQWEHWILLTADRHLDNPKSNLSMQRRHLDMAAERNAAIMDFGDLFCAMQSRRDGRGTKSDIKGENQTADYFGSLVRSSVDFFEPYAGNIALFGLGNHEAKILAKNEIDLTQALVDRLRDKGSPVVCGGIRGWVQILFVDASPNGKTFNQRLNIYYHHGHGGGGPVTRGVIQTNRRAVYLPDADIVVTGHIHESWVMEIPRARLSNSGVETQETQVHVCLPTYKEEFIGARDGWHHETGKPPKPLGAWWIRFFWSRAKSRVRYELHRAK